MNPIKSPFRIKSPFGEKRDFKPFGPHVHDGIDMVSDSGDQSLFAVCDGVVVDDRDDYIHAKRWVDKHDSVGNRIVQRSTVNGKVYYISYYHMANNRVSAGQIITKGEKIGEYGDVGMSLGAHVHLIAWDENWRIVDPSFLLEV